MFKYIKSFISSEVDENNWLSAILCFVDNSKVILDKGVIICGNVSADHYGFYINFRNFTIINGELHYIYQDGIKKIDPIKVFLHVRIGKSPYPVPINNLGYWYLYFTSPKNRLYKMLTEDKKINIDKIKVIDINGSFESKAQKIKITDIQNPFFKKVQVYDDFSVLFTELKFEML